jgi:transposase
VRIQRLPTVPRRLAAQQERDRLEARRLRAAELFAAGVRQAEVARQLEVSAQAVSAWHARWQSGGPQALRSRGPSGPAPRRSDQQLVRVEHALLEGATAHGFVGELWTLDRIATVIEAAPGSVTIRPGCGRCCITGWAGACSGRCVGLSNATRRRSTAGSSSAGRRSSKRPTAQSLPAYAPELNPTEGLWSSLKAVELANLTGPTLAEVIQQAHRGVERVRRTPHLAYSFLRHAGLSVS